MKMILGLLVIAVVAHSQQSSVYKTLWTSQLGPRSAQGIPNIGATTHQVMLYNSTAGTCTGALTIQGSNDNTNWITFGGNSNLGVPVGTVAEIRSNGLYPFLKVQWTGSCVTTVWYVGSKSAFDPFTAMGQKVGTTDGSNRSPLAQLDGGSSALVVYPISSNQLIYVSNNGTADLIPTGADPTAAWSIDSVIVGTAGVTSSLTIAGPLGTLAVIDTTTVRQVHLGLYYPPGNTQHITYTTTGGTPAKITFVMKGGS